jgi:hypothetical protein
VRWFDSGRGHPAVRSQKGIFENTATIPVSSAVRKPSVSIRVSTTTARHGKPTMPNRRRTRFCTGPSYVRKYSTFQPLEGAYDSSEDGRRLNAWIDGTG